MPVKYEPWAIKNEKGDLWGFKLLEGNYTGTIISINSVEMDDKSDDGTVALDFNFVQRPKGKTEEELFETKVKYIIKAIQIFLKTFKELKKRILNRHYESDSNLFNENKKRDDNNIENLELLA